MSNIADSDTFTLEDPGGEIHCALIGGRLRVDHGLAARETYRAGRGVGLAHIWLVDDLLSESRLEAVLPDYHPPSMPLNMLIVPERAVIARVRLLVELLAEEVAYIPDIAQTRG